MKLPEFPTFLVYFKNSFWSYFEYKSRIRLILAFALANSKIKKSEFSLICLSNWKILN